MVAFFSPMSYRLTAAAIAADVATAPQKMVLVVLADIADDAGKCWPSLGLIARRAAMSRKSVIDQIPKLEAAGHLSVRRDGKHNVYRVHPVPSVTDGDQTSHRRLLVTDGDQSLTVTSTVTHGDRHQSLTVTPLVTDGDPNQSLNQSENQSLNQSRAPESEPSIPAPGPEKPKRQRFIKPTIDEWTAYAKEMPQPLTENQSLGAWDYYEGNGWRVGRNPMVDWQATLRGWSRRQREFQQTKTAPQSNRTATLADGTVVKNVRSQFAKSR